MTSLEDARQVAHRLHSLGGGLEVIRKAAAREIAARDPVDANELLAALITLSQQGHEPASCVLGAFVSALGLEGDHTPGMDQLKRVARLQELPQVEALFADAPARLELAESAAARADARSFSESLGHLKQKARVTRDPDELARLVSASDPSVIRNALLNPRLTEALVVRMAARRPARPEPLIEIWRSPRWSVRRAVRRALVFNPYLPPEVGAKIVPLLNRIDLEELSRTASLHEALRKEAALLLSRL